jgi:hypothetical protein
MFEMDQPGIPRELSQRLHARSATITGSNPHQYTYDIEEMKIFLEELCAEEGIHFQLFTRARACLMEGDRIAAVITDSKSGPQAWQAKTFVDASGDGDLAAQAGCGFDLGQEETGRCQPMTYMALVSVDDVAAIAPYVCFWEGGDRHRHETVDYGTVGAFRAEIERAGSPPSYSQAKLFQVRGNLLALMVNHEYGISAIDAADLTRATVDGRREVFRTVKGLQGLGGVWESLQLVATCEQIGVREGRRIYGRDAVTREDLAAGRHHDDAVCEVHFGVDIHSTDKASGTGQDRAAHGATMKPYTIPMGALIARDVSNLLLGGRCISGDFVAHSSYRVTGVAAATGQAAGAAAALSAQHNIQPAALSWPTIQGALHNLQGSER